MFRFFCRAVLLIALGGSASAEVQSADAVAGQQLATAECSKCHALEGPAHASQTAPSLAAIAQMRSTTSMSLHAFLLTSHPRMPNFRLTSQEVDNVVAYILSLQRRR